MLGHWLLGSLWPAVFLYLGYFVSGVPFDRQKQLRKRLGDVYTVMSAERQVDRETCTQSQTIQQRKTGKNRETRK